MSGEVRQNHIFELMKVIMRAPFQCVSCGFKMVFVPQWKGSIQLCKISGF